VKITILGSAAAEAIPNPYCHCAICHKARIEDGRDRRARSAAIINDDLLVDLGPDIVSAASHWHQYLGNVHTLLVTHRHEDHWLPQNLMWRRPVFAPKLETHLSVFGPSDVVSDLPASFLDLIKARCSSVEGGNQWTSGSYTITAVPATHGDGQIQALLYVIDDGIHRIFYATDTAPLRDTAWDVLRSIGPMDLILLDATMGYADGGEAHHGIPQFLESRKMMIDEGIIIPSETVLAAHHFSHNAGLTHADLVRIFTPSGVEVTYDGWVINL
jgi:phosphoribosyl 1,2-cyclic phosphodiesterase